MKAKEKVVTIKECEEITKLHFTMNHTGKMSGMYSLSTSCTCNEFCKKRSQNTGSVCSHCYAQRQMKMYKTLEKCLIRNTEILTRQIIDEKDLPLINALYFRLEAFGDLNNATQVINYFNLCKKNPEVKFALWTKNLWLIEDVIKNGIKKPKNLNIVYSLHNLNEQNDKIFEWYPFVDKVFAVFDKKYIKENGIKINCGAENCLSCGKCYRKSKAKYINEKLK